MPVTSEFIELSSQGHCDIINITLTVNQKLKGSGLKNGLVNINVCGSTAAVTTLEHEPGLIQDMKEFFDRLIPEGKRYHHDDAWGDGNGYAHLRSALVGTSLTMSFKNGELMLGTWQQIIFIDFDNRPRERKLILQIMGE